MSSEADKPEPQGGAGGARRRLWVFQHVPFEGPGMIADWADACGLAVARTALYEAEARLPTLEDYDALVLMGGPMSVHDAAQHPWMTEEKHHLRAALAAGKPVLGVCLGAQLIADVLGAGVGPNPEREIGWHPIALTDEGATHPLCAGLNSAMTVFHWHGERFELPAGALRLAASEACDNQAFLWQDSVLGLQFHLEVEGPAIGALIRACPADLAPGPFVQKAAAMLAQSRRASTRTALDRLLDNWRQTWKS